MSWLLLPSEPIIKKLPYREREHSSNVIRPKEQREEWSHQPQPFTTKAGQQERQVVGETSHVKQVLSTCKAGSVANEGVVTCDQAKHWVPTGAWVGKIRRWKTCTCLLQRFNGVRAPGRSHLLMHQQLLHKQLLMQSGASIRF